MTASYFYAKIITFAIYLCIEKCIFEFFYLTSVLSFSLLCKRNWKSWWGKAKLNIGESLRTFLSKAVESYLFFYRLHQLERKKKWKKISKYRNTETNIIEGAFKKSLFPIIDIEKIKYFFEACVETANKI
jgi:hypothetical protein